MLWAICTPRNSLNKRARTWAIWDTQFAEGVFEPLKNWLTEKIYSQGQCYRANELIKVVTGKPLSHEPLMRHLRAKYEPLYGI